jgi:hypothetical protein
MALNAYLLKYKSVTMPESDTHLAVYVSLTAMMQRFGYNSKISKVNAALIILSVSNAEITVIRHYK